jgi:hypothetical protein
MVALDVNTPNHIQSAYTVIVHEREGSQLHMSVDADNYRCPTVIATTSTTSSFDPYMRMIAGILGSDAPESITTLLNHNQRFFPNARLLGSRVGYEISRGRREVYVTTGEANNFMAPPSSFSFFSIFEDQLVLATALPGSPESDTLHYMPRGTQIILQLASRFIHPQELVFPGRFTSTVHHVATHHSLPIELLDPMLKQLVLLNQRAGLYAATVITLTPEQAHVNTSTPDLSIVQEQTAQHTGFVL